MIEQLDAIGWAFMLGVITAMHPCPFTTIGVVSGMFVTLGRSSFRMLAFALGIIVTFAVLGGVVSTSVSVIPGVSQGVSTVFKPFLGPVLILVGMLQSGLIKLPEAWTFKLGNRWGNAGLAGCFAGGTCVALSFCPATAGIFFVLVVPVSVQAGTPFSVSTAYGLGYAIVPMGVMLALKVISLKLQELRATRIRRVITQGASFLLIIGGIYVSLKHTYGIAL